jgi:two-component system, sensor histidine kinase and response regulator
MKTILLVDDDSQLRSMFNMALTRKGYRVIEADSGVTGLELARIHLPDLILSDVHMPGGDGSTLLQEIRRDPELKSRQVVLITGRPDLVTPRQGMEEGADDFLVKPVSIKAVLSCVEARINRANVSWRVEDQLLADMRSAVPTNLPHEFFTPLAGIIGLMEIARSNFALLTGEEVQEIHNDVYQSALRLHRTLRNYLLILDIQAGMPERLISPLPARRAEECVHNGVNEALRLNDRREDVKVRVQACSIWVKPEDLGRMVEELVDNACKFSRQGTEIEVALSAEGYLTITDQGRGLTADEINRIGAFQQFDRKKQEQQGLGLGLVLVQRLAALCEARFSLNSEPGQGAQAQIAFSSGSPG